jgi:sulfur-carrier protein adenylyltransferase/sulfurtransferase
MTPAALPASCPARDAPPATQDFDYDLAVSRNIGWVTEWEQQKLRQSKIAIAGMGGVGGIHMLTLARLGIGRFSIADFDSFEIANFNRQMGASLRTLHQPKAASLAMLAREINPELVIDSFDSGLDDNNLEAFLDGASVYIDGLDFFVLDIRRKLFALARAKGIPAVTAAPIGMGTGYLVFTADGMSFQDYFGFGEDAQENYVRFLIGLTPAMLHRRYLADPTRVDLKGQRGPSTAMACQLCAGVAATEALKLILKRGPVRAVPWYHHVDPYLGKMVSRKLRWGVDGPVVGLKRRAIQKLTGLFSARSRPAEDPLPGQSSLALKLAEAARWAPSPDNCQPWRLCLTDEASLEMTIDEERGNPYQFAGSRPNWLSAGMALEAIRLEASREGAMLAWERQGQILNINARAATGIKVDPLAAFIRLRTTERGPLRRSRIKAAERAALENALGAGFDVQWRTGFRERLAYASLGAASTRLRLASEACFRVHQRVIDTRNRFSRHGLPLTALGLNPLSRLLLRLGLNDWELMQQLNKWGAARHLGAAEMDLLPALMSGGFALIRATDPMETTADSALMQGMRLYRFWLEAARLGLAAQPALGPLFACAIAAGEAPDFNADSKTIAEAERIRAALCRMEDPALPIFAFRLGRPRAGASLSRSVRHRLAEIIVNKP